MTNKKQDVHEFQDSLKKGEKGEKELDKFFKKTFEISDVPMELQRAGIDRVFIHKKTRSRCTVEYKTDFAEKRYGNVFLETWSNVQDQKRGWMYTTLAQWIYFYLPHRKEVCIIDVVSLKEHLKELEEKYPVKSALNRIPNNGGFYRSEGVCVPYKEFKKLAYQIKKVR